jgi:hypothetical protein
MVMRAVMRRAVGAVVALACVALLSSCSLGSFFQSDDQKADMQMKHIADAVKNHDAAALKKLFSPAAQKKATNLDVGLNNFLSAIPSHWTSWNEPDGGCGGEKLTDFGKETDQVSCFYVVSAGGKKYDVDFDYFPEEDFDSEYVGIYALGVEPHRASPYMANFAKWPIDVWASQFGVDGTDRTPTGDAGFYIPGSPDTIVHDVGLAPAVVLQRIEDAAKTRDTAAVRKLFSLQAREKAEDLNAGLASFFSSFPRGETTWKLEDNFPMCMDGGDYQNEVAAVCPTYRTSVNGKVYELYFTEFTAVQRDTANVGVYALGITSDTLTSGSKPKPPAAFTAWVKSQFPHDNGKGTRGNPGVFSPQN